MDAFSELAQGQAKSGEASKASSSSYRERNWSVSQLFQSPVISYVYERGWRQGFDWAGFPGADEEFGIVNRLYEETRVCDPADSEAVLDVSCGTGERGWYPWIARAHGCLTTLPFPFLRPLLQEVPEERQVGRCGGLGLQREHAQPGL